MRVWCKFEFRHGEEVHAFGAYDLTEALDHWAWLALRAKSFELARQQHAGLHVNIVQVIQGDDFTKRRPVTILATVVL